ncbi:MAG: ABC transporter permease [Vicinamibacteria bacterium]
MSNVWAIYRREIYSLFASWIAYVVMGLFLVIFGYFFYSILYSFIEYGFRVNEYGGAGTLNINQDMVRWLFDNTAVIVLFMIPGLTMRAFAEEKRSGTMELLLTSPMTDFQLVLGKFLAVFSLYAVMLSLTFIHMGVLFYYGEPEWQPLLAGYLGLLLMGGAFVSFGCLFSSFTRNQIVAVFSSFTVFLLLWLIGYSENWAGSWGSTLAYLSVTQHVSEFSKGVIDTKDLVYYVSFIGFGLFLTTQSVESHRWRG